MSPQHQTAGCKWDLTWKELCCWNTECKAGQSCELMKTNEQNCMSDILRMVQHQPHLWGRWLIRNCCLVAVTVLQNKSALTWSYTFPTGAPEWAPDPCLRTRGRNLKQDQPPVVWSSPQVCKQNAAHCDGMMGSIWSIKYLEGWARVDL